MMFLHKLTDWLRKRPEVKTPKARSSARLRLEELEDRMVPSTFGSTDTYTNVSIQITPGFTVTEKVTVTVTPFGSYNPTTGQTTPPPKGATNPPGGTVLLNLNNTTTSATLNNKGQATVTFNVPLNAISDGCSQVLRANFLGFSDSSGNDWSSSEFIAPIFWDDFNYLLPATLTFNSLSPQQALTTLTSLASFNNANGETDNFGLFSETFNAAGSIDSFSVLGMNFTGFFARAISRNFRHGVSTAVAAVRG